MLTKRLPWPTHPSLLVLPLLIHDRALGTLILGARRRHAFGDAVRPTLEVLASHLAVSLSNARMVHKLETMATTDGLTGLLNKRAMLDAGAQKIAAAVRFGRELSVLVVDIDFFKKVNDTYGHDIGDLVIRGLGDILKRQKRATDLVARFGGEEFIVLCEQTDEKGAMLLAERIREELGKTKFRTPAGALTVTCSVGVSDVPAGRVDVGDDVQGGGRGAVRVEAVGSRPVHGVATAAQGGERRAVAVATLDVDVPPPLRPTVAERGRPGAARSLDIRPPSAHAWQSHARRRQARPHRRRPQGPRPPLPCRQGGHRQAAHQGRRAGRRHQRARGRPRPGECRQEHRARGCRVKDDLKPHGSAPRAEVKPEDKKDDDSPNPPPEGGSAA